MTLLTLFRMGTQKPTSFSSVASTNRGINLQSFLTFSFHPFAPRTGVKFQGNLWCQSQVIEVEPRRPLKKSDFSGQILGSHDNIYNIMSFT